LNSISANHGGRQRGALPDGSRRFSVAIPPANGFKMFSTPKGCKHLILASLRDALPNNMFSGGLRFAPTSGYRLATLRVATSTAERCQKLAGGRSMAETPGTRL
jgi:hypothetical protein